MVRRLEGFTIAEIVVAVGVVMMVLVAVASGVSVAVRNTGFSKEKALSVRQAQEGMEWLRNQRDVLGWRGFFEVLDEDTSGLSVTYCLDQLGSSVGEFRSLSNSGSGCSADEFIDGTEYLREVELTLGGGGDEVGVLMRVRWEGGSGESVTELSSDLKRWR